MRVLLVEDEPDLGTAIHRVLSREKYVVDWVQDGGEAWAYLDNPNVHYTLAILDWMLPELSGIEWCQRLRTQNNPPPHSDANGERSHGRQSGGTGCRSR